MRNFLISMILLLAVLTGADAVPSLHGNNGFDGSIKAESGKLLCSSGATLKSSSNVSHAVSGTRNVLVLLVDFSNRRFDSERDAKSYKRMLETGSGLTMKKYYSDMSNGKLELKFEVCGPYMAEHEYSYYGQNGNNGDKYSAALVQEVINAAVSEKGNSFFARFDNDNDGFIDTVMAIHAGIGEEESGISTDIWSHSWKLSSAAVTGDGDGIIQCGSKKFDSYTMQPEYSNHGTLKGAGVGVFCHEYGHTLGLRDLYDTSYATQGVGHWSLMGSGNWGSCGKHGVNGADPAPLLAYERAWLGWLIPETIIPEETPKTYSFGTGADAKVYRIDLTEDGKQYLLLEGRKRNDAGSGMFVSEGGLLITHIHQGIIDMYSGSNSINNTDTRVHGINVLEAKSDHYSRNHYGKGTLWNSDPNNRITQTALFRPDTRTSIVPEGTLYTGAAMILFAASFAFRRYRNICVMLILAVLISVFCLACALEDGGSGGSHEEDWDVVSHPNTNYYVSESSVNSKVGSSGVYIENIRSGSFTVRLEKKDGKDF